LGSPTGFLAGKQIEEAAGSVVVFKKRYRFENEGARRTKALMGC
jgi:hypothetical protein